MKFTRIYLIGGTNGKANNTDYVIGYKAENGKVIIIRELINSSFRWYEVDGKSYETLKQAKAAC